MRPDRASPHTSRAGMNRTTTWRGCPPYAPRAKVVETSPRREGAGGWGRPSDSFRSVFTTRASLQTSRHAPWEPGKSAPRPSCADADHFAAAASPAERRGCRPAALDSCRSAACRRHWTPGPRFVFLLFLFLRRGPVLLPRSVSSRGGAYTAGARACGRRDDSANE